MTSSAHLQGRTEHRQAAAHVTYWENHGISEVASLSTTDTKVL
jgi:hypothetical protein